MMAQHYQLSDLNPGDVLELPQYDLSFGAAGVPEPGGQFCKWWGLLAAGGFAGGGGGG